MITDVNTKVFDKDKIKKGFLIYAKHKTWDEGKSGYIIKVTENAITVQYLTGIGNITNHFFLPVEEVYHGEWLIRWSKDLSVVESEGGQPDEA